MKKKKRTQKKKKKCSHMDASGKSLWRMSYALNNIVVYNCKRCGEEIRKEDYTLEEER